MESSRELRKGVLCGISAYLVWGLSPIYFHSLVGISPGVILCHRIVQSVGWLTILVFVMGNWREVAKYVTTPRTLILLIFSTLSMAANWLIFIYATTTGQVLQASLGYFITPLLSAMLGLTVLRETLRPTQWISFALAAVGVLLYAISRRETPTLALLLAVSFASYAFFRKVSGTKPLPGITVETWLLLVPAMIYLMNHVTFSNVTITESQRTIKLDLLYCAGVVTTVPLLLFAGAAVRLPLTTIGLLQYITPTFQFLCGVVIYGEAFHAVQAIAFTIIWIALGIYSFEAWTRNSAKPQPVQQASARN